MELRRIKILTVALSFGGLLGFELLRHFVVQPATGEESPHLAEHVVAAIFLGIAVVAFTFAIFRLLERAQAQLVALNEASLAITADLSLDIVLQRVVELARSVARASYASVRMDDEGRTLGSGEMEPGAVTVSLPIVVRGRRLGELDLASPPGTRWPASDRAALETFATNAGIAIENARLFAQAQELVALRERTRIGMDLHDGMIQELYAIGLKLDDGTSMLADDMAEGERSLREARDELRHVIAELRTYVYGLHDGDRSVDVGPALKRLGEEFSSTSSAVSIEAEERIRLPGSTAAHVVHIVREALANALRHADPSCVRVCVRTAGPTLRIDVEDDGRGFDPSDVLHGLGLKDMRDRAALFGGRLSIHSAVGEGAKISLSVPIDDDVSASLP